VTNDGVLLEENGLEVGVSYRRISAIEADRSPGGRAEALRPSGNPAAIPPS
jgi:hypothetical protein